MATVDKNFKVKHGLIVEGTTATVNGEDIITTGNTTDDIAEGSVNLYFTDARAAAAVADEIATAVGDAVGALDTDDVAEGTNLYFTNSRALTATASAYDAAGAASAAQTAAESYADGLASNYDAAGSASAAQTAAQSYADGLASNYDAAGAAATAESNANSYTDTELADYTLTSDLDTTVGGYGYVKTADLSGLATESYVNTAVDNLVDGAPGLLDTLNEIAAAIADDANYATTMTTALAGKQDELTAGNGIDITGDTISVAFDAGNGLAINGTNLTVDTNVIATISYVDGLASNYDAAGAAAAAETAANAYADETFVTLADLPGQLDDYVPTSEKGQALGVATLDASGYVPEAQLGNLPANYVTSVGDNLSVTDGVLDLGADVAIEKTDIKTTSLETGQLNSNGSGGFYYSGTAKIESFTHAVTSAAPHVFEVLGTAMKLVVFARSAQNSDVHMSEFLIATNGSPQVGYNAYITEYASITSNSDLFTLDFAATTDPGMGDPSDIIITSLVPSINVAISAQVIL